MALDKKAQIHPIGAEDSGVAEQGVDEVKEAVEWGILVEEVEDQVGDEEEHLDQPDLTRWHVIGAGFVAIWPVTVPNPESQSGGSSQNGSSKGTSSRSGQKGPQRGRGRGRQVRFGAFNVLYDEDGNSYPVDDAGQLYIPLEFAQDADRRWRLRRKKIKTQKTKKDLCECGR